MPEAERNRFLLGMYSDESDGQAYYAFRRDEHVRNTDRQPGTLFIGMDFNVDPMTAVIGQYYNGKFHIHDEIFLRNSDTFKMADELKKRNYRGTVIPDSTGSNRKTSGITDHQILLDAGFRIPYVLNPHQSDRVNNINRLFTSNRIIINPRCEKLINDLERVSWKDNKLNQKTDKLLTHVSDCLGYLCWKLAPIEEHYETEGIIIE
jgi:hypothetical protein